MWTTSLLRIFPLMTLTVLAILTTTSCALLSPFDVAMGRRLLGKKSQNSPSPLPVKRDAASTSTGRDLDLDLDRGKRKAIKDIHSHWPGGVIPYHVSSAGEFSDEDKMTILAAMDIWSADTCVTFRPATGSDKDFVTFVDGKYCWSYIGRKGGEQFVELNSRWCRDLKTVLHEIGHVIGLYHEHSRPDRDKHVEILWHNIAKKNRYNFKTSDNMDTHGAPYDFKSIMHYRDNEFSTKKGEKTIQSLHDEHTKMGRHSDLSFYDVRTVSLMYKCYQKCGVYIADLACRDGTDGFMGRDCDCHYLETYTSSIIRV